MRSSSRAFLLLAIVAAGCQGNGPDMTPGQDCLAGNCHRRFTVAGTIFEHADSLVSNGQAGAVVTLTDADGQQVTLATNAVGNFWTGQPLRFPLTTTVQLGSVTRHMAPLVDRGSCNNCHTNPPTNGAAGLAYVTP